MEKFGVNQTRTVQDESNVGVMDEIERKARDFIENVLIKNLGTKYPKDFFMYIKQFNGKAKCFIVKDGKVRNSESYSDYVVNKATQLAKDYGICSKVELNCDKGYKYEFWIGSK